ncbi:MAG: DUF4919 domain-containing protein [candidate division WOR-3 bacterium]
MKKGFILIVFTLFFTCSTAKKNKEIDSGSNYILFDYINLLDGKNYYSLLDSIKNGKSEDFFTLRMAYTKTKIYDPYDNKIDGLRKQIEFNIEEKNFNKALKIAKEILGKRYIDIRTHLYCSNIYSQIGDSVKSNYHNGIYNGLLNSIYFSGDGKSPKTAFIVIEISEEYDLLNWLNLTQSEQYLTIKDGYSFDIIKAFNENRETELFFNIVLALKRFSEEMNLHKYD